MVNKALTEYDFGARQKQVEQTYELPVTGIIPESNDILRLASRGIFCLDYPTHPISQAIEKVAKQIMN